MSTGKKVLNAFGIIFASILSIVLVLMLIVSPIFFSARSLIKPEQIANLVTNLDYKEILSQGEIADKIADSEVNSDAMAAILSSPIAEEAIELYVTDITKAITGDFEQAGFTVEELKRIINENIDEAVEIVKEVAPEDSEATDEELKELITQTIDEHGEEIINELPSPEEFKELIDSDNDIPISDIFNDLNSFTTSVLPIISAIVLISGLIFVCRLWKFKGVIWLSVDLYIASVILAILCILIKSTSILTEAISDLSSELSGVLASIVSMFANGLILRTVIMFVIGVGMTVGHIYIKKYYKNKQLAFASSETNEQTFVTEAVEEESLTVDSAEQDNLSQEEITEESTQTEETNAEV